MTLRIDPAWDSEAQEIKTGGTFFSGLRIETEHYGANFDTTDTRFDIQCHGKCLARVLQGFYVRQKTAGVEVNRMAARRHDNRRLT